MQVTIRGWHLRIALDTITVLHHPSDANFLVGSSVLGVIHLLMTIPWLRAHSFKATDNY